jgi:hypothetical protein
MRLAFGSNDMVRYKREFVITEFVINELNCILEEILEIITRRDLEARRCREDGLGSLGVEAKCISESTFRDFCVQITIVSKIYLIELQKF